MEKNQIITNKYVITNLEKFNKSELGVFLKSISSSEFKTEIPSIFVDSKTYFLSNTSKSQTKEIK